MDNAVSQVEEGRAVLDPGILTSCWKGHDATIRVNFFTRMYLLVKRNEKRGGGGQSKYLLLTLTGGEADAWLDTKDQLFKNWNPFVQYFSNLVFFFS